MNKVELIGNLGADPETRYTQEGKAVTSMRLATNEKWTGKDGQAHERTEWHRVVTFGTLAETCRDSLAKGKLVRVHGRIQTRSFEDKDKNKRYVTEIVGLKVEDLNKPKEQAKPAETK